VCTRREGFPRLFRAGGNRSRLEAVVRWEASVGLLAEQIVIDCAPSALEDLFCHRPADWMAPLLRMAGDAGEAAGLAVLGERADADRRQSPRRPEHRVEVRETRPGDRSFRVGLLWQTTDYRALFAAFEGTLEVRSLDDQTVVSLEGLFAERRPAAVGRGRFSIAARRAAESAVRSLLGHLRDAVEDSAFSPGSG
jgi:hypothetical protein